MNDTSKTLIPITKDQSIKYDSIICIITKEVVDTSYIFKKKTIINLCDDLNKIKTYIYCKEDILIATSLDVQKLKSKINEIIEPNLSKNWL